MICRSLEEAAGRFPPSAVTIGNFDGVHAGHRRILRRVAALAAEHGWNAGAVTFDPHPAVVVAPDRAPELLTSPEERAALMAGEGITHALILPFTLELSLLSPEEFVRDVLVERLGVRAVLVGGNFRFGHRHAGDTRLLEELGRKYGFLTETVPAVTMRGRLVSSSEVRGLIRVGNVSLAARLLEQPYAIAGEVVHGFGIGARQTVPTLNLKPPDRVLPAGGVYVTRTAAPDDGREWPSVTNVGYRPTFDGEALTIETFLLPGLDGSTPGRIRVEFLLRLREERKFSSPQELKARILRDVARANRYFGLAGRICRTGA